MRHKNIGPKKRSAIIDFFILSILLHMVVFIGFSKISNKDLKNGVKPLNINVNLTMSTMGNSDKTLAKMTTKKETNIAERPKEIPKKSHPKKKTSPKKQVVQKKAVIIRPIDSNEAKPNKNIEKNITTNDTILGDQENDKNLIKIKNGQYALKNQKVSGIHVVIHKEIPPSYPNLALKMGYRKETLVKVKFLVDRKGRVGEVKFYTNSKYGFEDEVEKALKQWVFEPIIYRGKPMAIYFYKIFRFVSKS
ncbi:energy transducer TonB [Psychrilyobacter sp.]|uniref:energy transducer TonB n=1 Tax=Psychrilyobacter sp. TaxID=2586924 RepID=UPI00301762A2